MKPVICQYCQQPAIFTGSAEVYRGVDYGPIYLCRPCQAWVGVHKGTKRPKGCLANAELREAKKRAHAAFDPHWMGNRGARDAAYYALAGVMHMDRKMCHIGEMGIADCQRVVEACEYGLIFDVMEQRMVIQ